jgi:hypothetical protein
MEGTTAAKLDSVGEKGLVPTWLIAATLKL